jgi:hypothetical protein
MAWLPPSRHTLHRGLRIPDLRKGDDSPLSTSFHRDVPGACHSRRLQTQKLHRCGPSGTFQTPLRPCADGSFSPSSKTCRDVRAAPLRSGPGRSTKLYDAVRLARPTSEGRRSLPRPPARSSQVKIASGHTDRIFQPKQAANSVRISLRSKSMKSIRYWVMVGVAGFEPATPASRTQCSTGLSHTPTRRRLIALGFAHRKKVN